MVLCPSALRPEGVHGKEAYSSRQKARGWGGGKQGPGTTYPYPKDLVLPKIPITSQNSTTKLRTKRSTYESTGDILYSNHNKAHIKKSSELEEDSYNSSMAESERSWR